MVSPLTRPVLIVISSLPYSAEHPHIRNCWASGLRPTGNYPFVDTWAFVGTNPMDEPYFREACQFCQLRWDTNARTLPRQPECFWLSVSIEG